MRKREEEEQRQHPTALRLPISNNREENIEAYTQSVCSCCACKRWSLSYWPDRCQNRVIGFKQTKDCVRLGGQQQQQQTPHHHIGLSAGHHNTTITINLKILTRFGQLDESVLLYCGEMSYDFFINHAANLYEGNRYKFVHRLHYIVYETRYSPVVFNKHPQHVKQSSSTIALNTLCSNYISNSLLLTIIDS